MKKEKGDRMRMERERGEKKNREIGEKEWGERKKPRQNGGWEEKKKMTKNIDCRMEIEKFQFESSKN